MTIPHQSPAQVALDDLRLLDSLADGVYATDRNRRIIYWNRAAERITGYRADEVVGRSCSANVLCHVDKDGHRLCGEAFCPLHRAIVTGKSSRQPLLVQARTKAGSRIATEVSVAPLLDREGSVIGGIESFREATDLVDSLKSAAAIQRAALACELPRDDRVHFGALSVPVGYVGGDFYRVERLDEHRFAMLVADVMGHGLSAALHTTQLRAVWEDVRDDLGHPDTLLATMNRRLTVLLEKGQHFASAIAGVLDLTLPRLTYSCAGHTGPLVKPSAESRFRALSPTEDLPLGLFAEASYSTRQIDLMPGAQILLCSDGLVEEQNATGEQLGEDGLVAMLDRLAFDGTQEALWRLERAALAFGNGLRFADDVTVVCARL